MNNKMTNWFPSRIKPVRVGVFLCTDGWFGQGFQFWNGKFWGGWASDPITATKNACFRSEFQNPRWRGFTEKQT